MEQKAEESLVNLVDWRHTFIPSTTAYGKVNLSFGLVGQGEPTGVVIAGVHGDEGLWGAWAIRKFMEATKADELCGSLRIVSVANPLAMEADERNSPIDHLDLNRVFPGNSKGSHTESLAAELVENVLQGVDVIIDIHGGGSWCLNSFVFSFSGSEELAEAFNAPFILKGEERPGALSSFALRNGVKIVSVEMGGRSEYEEYWASMIAAGLRRALGIAGVLQPPKPFERQSIHAGDIRVLRPSSGEVLKPNVSSEDIGTLVDGGFVLGYLVDPVTFETVETFKAPFDKTAILLLRPSLCCLDGGAMTYVIAKPE
jgi:predicted deacylase